jgi:hypothetical protein
MIITVKLPKRLKWKKESPYQDFYMKAINAAIKSKKLTYTKGTKVQVVAFTINPKDLPILSKFVMKHLKSFNPYSSHKNLLWNVQWTNLDLGPCLSNKVKVGSIQIDTDKLYED